MPDIFSLIGRSLGTAALLLSVAAAPISIPEARAQDTQAAAAAPSADADADTPDLLTEDELEVLVARIALYPDELVAVITSASIFPLQIVEAQRFLDQSKAKKDLKPKDSWDGSVISLLNYPQVVKMMSDDLEWTQSLGSALTYQQKDVLIAIQTLRDKAVADNVIKSDDKITVVNEGDNVVIQSTNPEKVYVPQYEPQMLYEPSYAPAPISYYPEPYPNYYYPTATFFAGAVTGAIWASAVDWDDWGVWGGNWGGGDVDIDCDNCFNNVDIDRDKFKMGDVDWKNVDRSKIKFDKNQFNNIDRTKMRNDFKGNRENNIGVKAKDLRRDGGNTIANNRPKVTTNDIRKSKVDADRARNKSASAGNQRPGKGQNAANQRPGKAQNAGANRPKASQGANRSNKQVNRQVKQPKAGARTQNRSPKNNSVLGNPGNRHQTNMSSNRGRQSMGGGHRGGGGHKVVRHGGGGGRRR
ncbi:hypothetical protein QO002_003657 [Pararhizobium capsulatum DSM 1112]|uniref:DUF3300 domain-containing protein n=1 Tax=Pararhizobium capsulatum DSM 1112 TaxID=1121113 RepID=A0ABU0BUX4_9HYPH|nr:DUF3300 domain-containing protein [Pararhizobium capsulatum]MDQ0321519.1 hypothetical protein [Pararhizobium capsulatum DSM 1112]